MTPKELEEALAVYKVRYGYTSNKTIDLDKLNEILKEINDSKTTKRKSTKRSRRSNK